MVMDKMNEFPMMYIYMNKRLYIIRVVYEDNHITYNSDCLHCTYIGLRQFRSGYIKVG